ncbi:hypothetical protein [Comamonas squillarum]|uniref:Uncharacterized protein n=1 Tax=Comamonas squillarum TaxID=2977320 RepID=A0ABY6A3U5_9BURK|nr:hypothetical protein [Comamonas sp. PR12]UXC19685.1 hypothetical protein N4T19_06100 [Comamonas sp. PR12]
MPDRFQLTRNAQFYRKNANFDPAWIKQIMDLASSNSIEKDVFIINDFRVNREYKNNLRYTYSAKVFKSQRPVYFLDEDLSDTIYAFIILIEIENYIAIVKKSCSNFSEILDGNFQLVESKEITSKLTDDVEFQKLSIRNMTNADSAMRSRAYEATNLNGLLSLHAAGRSIPYFLKLRQGQNLKTISGTGRVTEFSRRESIDEISSWIKKQIDFINSPSVENFLDSFAGKTDINEVLGHCAPNAILVEAGSLFDRIRKDDLALSRNIRGSLQNISTKMENWLARRLENVYEIDTALNIIGANGRIKKNKNSLTFNSKILSKIYIGDTKEKETLQRFIIKNGFYSITFTNPKYMYFMGACFEDKSGISEIDSILNMLHPVPNMGKVKSEKGTFRRNSRNFSKDSMFHLIESHHKKDDYIFCDDLGNEWADHITINLENTQICFIHSKHGELSTSASKLHEVVGQGIKNLGNMFFDAEKIDNKLKNSFSKKYTSSTGVATNISTARKGNELQFKNDMRNVMKDYKLNRRCILSCSFLSKQNISYEFNRMKNGIPVKGNITQLLWILSSFSHAAKEMNIHPEIYCNH